MAEGKTSMFGKTYNTIGSTDSNFIIKTKGDLKIQWSNKFIDLIKNGKIVSNSENIFKVVESENDIKGDGIYLIGEQLWISLEGNNFKISQDTSSNGSMFVSYDQEQETTDTQKYRALTNIGLYYKTLNDVQGIKSGIVYVEETQKLYTIVNGVIKPYILEQEKQEQSIVNEFNELRVGPLHLYSQEGFGVINSDVDMIISSQNIPYIILDDSVKFQESVQIDDSKELKSKGATEEVGYRLYIENGLSTLEIDNLVQRRYPLHITYAKLMDMIEKNKLSNKMYYVITDFQNPWEVSWEEEPLYYEDQYTEIEGTQYISGIRNAMKLIIQATSSNTIDPIVQDPLNPKWIMHYDPYYQESFRNREVEGQIVHLSSKGKITYLKDEFGNEGNFNFRHFKFKRDNQWFYCMDTKQQKYGEFLMGNNNKFIFQNIDMYVQVFQCEPIKNEETVTGYKVVIKDSDIQMSKGHNLLINSISNNNTFEFGETSDTIYHTIEQNVILENNNFYKLKEFQILENSIVINNDIQNINQKCIIEGRFENNKLINVSISGEKLAAKEFIGNTIQDTTLIIQDSGELIQNNTITNSQITINNRGVINNNNIENVSTLINEDLLDSNILINISQLVNTGTINKNTLSNIEYLQNSTILSENVLSNINRFNNSGAFFTKNNIQQGNRVTNQGIIQNNNINIVYTLTNNSNLINNNIESITELINTGDIKNNTLGEVKDLINSSKFENNNINNLNIEDFRNEYEFTGNTINNISNSNIKSSIKNNTINTISETSNIYAPFQNNTITGSIINSDFNNTCDGNYIYGNIKNSYLGVFVDNTIQGDIINCQLSSFSNNASENSLEGFKATGQVNDCNFNKKIFNFTSQDLICCSFEYIDNLTLNFPVYYTTFHGYIGNITRQPTKYEISLLENPSKKTEVFPNIKVISIPDIMVTGMIMMWYSAKEIPKGWAICNGQNGTPDLTDRFIKATDSWDTTGEVNPEGVLDGNTIQIKQENLPEHSHPHQPHTHEMSELTGYTKNSGELEFYGKRLTNPVDIEAVQNVEADEVAFDVSYGTSGYYYIEEDTEYRGGNHMHDVVINGGKIQLATSMEQKIEWLNTPIKIEPKHFRLIFIMKIDED